MPTQAEYYADPTQWGDYQYVTMEDVINNYLMGRDADDYSATVPRFKLIYQAKRGLRELYYDVVKEVKAIELTLSDALTVTLPPDFVNYVRISWVDEEGELHPMAMDSRLSIAREYLQDSEYRLLFDNEGCVLIGDSPARPASQDATSVTSGDGDISSYPFCSTAYMPNKDMSRVFVNGKYRLDKNAGLIQFGSDAQGRNIVMEYISDGLYTGCETGEASEIRIHKFAETALIDYIHHELVKNRRNVPYNEKIRARKEFWNSRRLAKLRMNTLRKEEILQYFRGQSKVIK